MAESGIERERERERERDREKPDYWPTYKIVFSWVDLKHLKIGQMGYRVFDPEALAIMIILMY